MKNKKFSTTSSINNTLIKAGVMHSIKKYHKTYKLLEVYDKSTDKNPAALADPGRLRSLIRIIQK